MILKRPFCIDISHWKPVPDFAAIAPRPDLILTKATEGVSYVDKTFAGYFTDMRRAGIARGAYHFFRKAYDATKQAQHFVSTIAQYATKDDILVLDFEEGGETAGQIVAFLQFVQSRFPLNIIMNYSRKNLMDSIPMTQTQRDILTGYPVWVAGYPDNPDLFSSVPTGYLPDQTKWGPVWLWQYTASGHVDGISGDTDCNWMHETLYKIVSGFNEQPPIGDTMDRYRATWDDGCNRRPAPNVNNTPVPPFIAKDAEFDVSGYSTPPGKTEAQELWGLLTDTYWVALVYNSQVRAVRVSVEPVPEFRWPDRFSAEYTDAAGNVVANKFYVPE